MTLIDQKARETARTRLDRNIVVEAGAGTGKTKLLIDRILCQLLEGPEERSDITRIVALTFTKKAAGEIKVRLQKALTGVPSPRAVKALADLERAPIGTIHSFAAQLLQLYPLEARVDPGFSVDEGPAFDELFASEWALWLDAELGEQAAREASWAEVLRHAGLEDLEALARALCAARPRGGDGRRALSEYLSLAAAEAKGLPEGKPRAAGNIGPALESISRRLRETAAAAADGAEPLPAHRNFETLANASWPKGWPEAGSAVYERVRRLAEKTGPFEHRLVRKAAALLEPFVARFQETYGRRGHVSFDGLLLKTRDLLRDTPRVREELKAAYDAILVDEFQDTDPLQGELLLYLAEAPGRAAQRWEDVRLAPGKLFVVGDPKQSIYRFRGADIAAYQRFTELMQAQGAELCRLQTNFRSTAEILKPVNHVFSKVMLRKEGSQPQYVPIEAHDDEQGEAVELLRVEAPAGVKLASEEAREAEAEAVAAWIAEHCGEGKRPYKDVAVLLRSTSPLPIYLAPLKRLGIPYVVEGEKYFYGTQEILDFLNLLRAVDDPYDAVSLLGLLRSPLVGLTDAEIMRLADARALSWRKAEAIPADLPGRRRLTAFYARLAEHHALVGRLPLGEFVRRLLADSFLVELASYAYHREQTIGNLAKFARLAVAAGDDRGLTLKEFAHEVAQSVETAQEEGESPLADEHLDAVRLLTIHKAKGLEFPVVFLPNLSGRRGGAGEKPALRLDWSSGETGLRLPKTGAADGAMAMIEMQEEERERDEEARLFYVAMTRARERLILLMNGDFSTSAPFATLLEEGGALSGDSAGIRITAIAPSPSPLPQAGEGGPRTGEGEPFDIHAFVHLWAERRRRFETDAARKQFVTPAGQPLPSPSPVNGEGETYRIDPARRESAAAVGSLCHFVLERWDYGGKNDLTALVAAGVKALDAEAAAAEAQEILSGFAKSAAAKDLAKAEIAGREMPVLFEKDGQVVRGAIDLLYKEGGRWVVADYKTEKVAKKDLDAAARRYAPQARLYGEAVKRVLGEAPVLKIVFLRAGAAVELS